MNILNPLAIFIVIYTLFGCFNTIFLLKIAVILVSGIVIYKLFFEKNKKNKHEKSNRKDHLE